MRPLIAALVIAAAISSLSAGDVQQAPLSCAPSPQSVKTGAAPEPTTRPVVAHSQMVRQIRIELALFGSGKRLADVTDRVAQLLREEPEGFTARADWLRIDPASGKNKSLMIRYRYGDQERYFVITGGNRASYADLGEDSD
jgi:hypothetical protein